MAKQRESTKKKTISKEEAVKDSEVNDLVKLAKENDEAKLTIGNAVVTVYKKGEEGLAISVVTPQHKLDYPSEKKSKTSIEHLLANVLNCYR
jgi:hypothetical protein